VAEDVNLLLGVLCIIGIVLCVGFILAVAVIALKRDSSHGTSGTLSGAAPEIQSLLEPEKKKVVETMRARDERSEADQSGDD
jgi:hypothetical protein